MASHIARHEASGLTVDCVKDGRIYSVLEVKPAQKCEKLGKLMRKADSVLRSLQAELYYAEKRMDNTAHHQLSVSGGFFSFTATKKSTGGLS